MGISVEEYARKSLERILEIGVKNVEPATERLHKIADEALRYYYYSLLRTKLGIGDNRAVLYGPFAGMRIGSEFLPLVIGSYEAELHTTIEAIVQRGYERVVNIGCGDGYYAVGLARRLPGAHVFAFDSEPAAQRVCHSLAEVNGVGERVTVRGKCTPEILRDLATPGTLVFCDCEGSELELLDPTAVPMLSHCDVVVEMHDFLRPDASFTLLERFRSTHSVNGIPPSAHDPSAYPILESLSDFDRVFALCEFRPGRTPWGIFVSNTPQHVYAS